MTKPDPAPTPDDRLTEVTAHPRQVSKGTARNQKETVALAETVSTAARDTTTSAEAETVVTRPGALRSAMPSTEIPPVPEA